MKYKVGKDLTELTGVVQAVETFLREQRVSRKGVASATLTLEEIIVKLVDLADEGESVGVTVRKSFGVIRIAVSARGKELDMSSILSGGDVAAIDDEIGSDTAEAIRDLVIRANADRLRNRYSKGVNTVTVNVQRSDNASLLKVVTAMLAAVVFGVLCRLFLPSGVTGFMSENLLVPLYTMFLNAIKMIMAPLVFFSMAACVGSFTNMRDLGRSGLKVFSMYFVTTTIAIIITFCVVELFHPGAGVNLDFASESVDYGHVDVSLVDALVNIVPSNLLGAFLGGDMLQIIFIAIIVGISVSSLGRYSQMLRNFIESMDALIGKITTLVIKCLPVAVFASFSNLVLTMDLSTIGALGSWMGCMLLCLVCMWIVYLMLLAIIGRLSPLKFLSKYVRVPLTAMSTCSSSATMPVALESCKRVGVAPRIYKFSIPLGTTINMDATSMFLVLSSLFLAAVSGVSIPAGVMFSFITTVLLLSMAAPGIPGAAIACLATLLSILHVPAESIALIIGVTTLFDPVLTATNVLGDGVVTTLIAKSEKALDLDVFNI